MSVRRGRSRALAGVVALGLTLASGTGLAQVLKATSKTLDPGGQTLGGPAEQIIGDTKVITVWQRLSVDAFACLTVIARQEEVVATLWDAGVALGSRTIPDGSAATVCANNATRATLQCGVTQGDSCTAVWRLDGDS